MKDLTKKILRERVKISQKSEITKSSEKIKEEVKPLKKKYYTVEIECLIPATVKYKVYIEEGKYEEGIKETYKMVPIERPKLKLGALKRLSAKVLEYGTNIIRYTKKI